ncbi:hypothetical protein ACIRP2_15225 [Streptomyces sp. NPDC101194]|uniref:hypothetical protein n=1 Tax=Streptomyces sp. NPDC101194 TaxID=3366127 RepID=UPI0037F185BA
MNITPYVDSLRHGLAVAADARGDEARALVDQLSAPLETAARLAVLGALSAAMDQVSRDLAPGSVAVRLHGLDVEFAVTLPHTCETCGGTPDRPDVVNQERQAVADGARAAKRRPAPAGHIRMRFSDADALDAAAGLFRSAVRDDEALALHIPSDCSTSALKSVLAALDSASIEAEALTMHTPDLHDVFSSVTGMPHADDTGTGRRGNPL